MLRHPKKYWETQSWSENKYSKQILKFWQQWVSDYPQKYIIFIYSFAICVFIILLYIIFCSRMAYCIGFLIIFHCGITSKFCVLR